MAEVRRRRLASSPLHFAERLPPTQIHHGAVDSAVPVANAAAMAERFAALGRPAPDYEVIIHEEAGHLLNDEGRRRARQFLVAQAAQQARGTRKMPAPDGRP